VNKPAQTYKIEGGRSKPWFSWFRALCSTLNIYRYSDILRYIILEVWKQLDLYFRVILHLQIRNKQLNRAWERQASDFRKKHCSFVKCSRKNYNLVHPQCIAVKIPEICFLILLYITAISFIIFLNKYTIKMPTHLNIFHCENNTIENMSHCESMLSIANTNVILKGLIAKELLKLTFTSHG